MESAADGGEAMTRDEAIGKLYPRPGGIMKIELSPSTLH